MATSVIKRDAQLLALPFTVATEFTTTGAYVVVDAWVVGSAAHVGGPSPTPLRVQRPAR